MPVYEYKCDAGHVEEAFHSRDVSYVGEPCPAWSDDGSACNSPVKKHFGSIQFAPVMQEHWSLAVGKPISSMRQFEDELARSSDAATNQTGIEHKYVPCDPSQDLDDE